MFLHSYRVSTEVWLTLVMVSLEISNMKETEAKRDLLSIDDFDDELSQLIDWGIPNEE